MSNEPRDTDEAYSGRSLDPVTLQVIGGEFDTIAAEMGHKLIQSSYSAIIRENEDMGCGLFTRDLREIAESDFTPMHVGSLPGYLRGMVRAIEERGETVEEVVNEGDVFLHNHPHYGASHSADIAAIVPIFYEGELVGWSADTAHLLDIGAAEPGFPIMLYDMYAEGQLLKARKVVREGERIQEIWDHLRDNTRTSTLNEGDLNAMIAAAEIGRDRYLELIDEWGRETIERAGEDLIEYAEDLFRSKVSDLPDGEYHEKAYLDGDFLEDSRRLKIDVKVRIRGDDITIDLTDSCDETQSAVNAPLDGTTKVCAYFTLRSLLLDPHTHDEYIPKNSGTFEPINVETRKGSIFNPREPRAAFSRISIVSMMGDLIVKAMRDVLPDGIMAGHSAQEMITTYSGEVEGSDEYWVHLEVNKGGYGGRPHEDGIDCVGGLATNIRNGPIEDIELTHPLRVDRYCVREDGDGAGKHRGGRGSVREITMLGDTGMALYSCAKNHVPWGVFGGEDGEHSSFWHVEVGGLDDEIYSEPDELPSDLDDDRDVEAVNELPSTFPYREFEPGDRMITRGPVAGGYGDPHDRPTEQVLADYRDGLITHEGAREDYGVVIRDGEIDEEATADLRDD